MQNLQVFTNFSLLQDLVALAVVLVNITSLYGHSFKERPDKEHEFRFPEDLWPLIKHIGRSTIIVVLDQDTQVHFSLISEALDSVN